MLSINSIHDAIDALQRGCVITQCDYNHPILDTKLRVAGRLMKLTMSDWWYVIFHPEARNASGIVPQKLFFELYKLQLIAAQPTYKPAEHSKQFRLNLYCDTGELSRYKHKLNSWAVVKSTPNHARQ